MVVAGGTWYDSLHGTVGCRPFSEKKYAGVVVYDSKVASTSNIASSVAGIENLIAVRYDISPNSLYTRLVLQGPKLAVKCWLVNKDGSSFHGQRKDCRNRSAFTGSRKSIPMVYREIPGRKGYAIRSTPLITSTSSGVPILPDGNEPSPIDQSWLSARKLFFDLSPWGRRAGKRMIPTQRRTGLYRYRKPFCKAYKQIKEREFVYRRFPELDFINIRSMLEEAAWRCGYRGEFSRIISAYNAFKIPMPSDWEHGDSSFWQHFPLQEKYPQKWWHIRTDGQRLSEPWRNNQLSGTELYPLL